ncbi:hypothetical protein [Bauldia sp.]|uniref:hypothetical protein n=1 Tax=Bauldia sp. TaxID=2575872 RepID=UPI003BAC873B
MAGKTTIGIEGEAFILNGRPTFEGRAWKGRKIEGLLPNTRMVQGIFDDLNPDTAGQWAYPDTGQWDPDRNTSEFIAAMPEWLAHGVVAFTINLQGGSPYGYSMAQPWINSGINPDGSLHPDFMARLTRILDAADALGMVVIVGYYYFGQEKYMNDDDAVRAGVVNATRWLLDAGYRNVMVEINNECDIRYRRQPLVPENVHELIDLAKGVVHDGRRLLVGTSYGGNRIPGEMVTRASDFMLIHGNSVSDPDRIRQMVRDTRAVKGYSLKPILFNEDDHFDFDKPDNNFIAATDEYASWGYFDYRMEGEGFDDGYQSVPVNWDISSPRKRGFFDLAKEITGV